MKNVKVELLGVTEKQRNRSSFPCAVEIHLVTRLPEFPKFPGFLQPALGQETAFPKMPSR